MNALPKSITPCPINEAVFEIRFTTNVPSEVLFGLVFGAIRSDFPEVSKQPITQIPEQLRSTDENLSHLPEYRLANEKLVVQLGPRSFSIASVNGYIGWQQYRSKIQEMLEHLKKFDVVQEVYRIGLRYINIFDFDIFPKSSMQIMQGNESFMQHKVQLIAEVSANDFVSTIRMAKDAAIHTNRNKFIGSVIDIDTSSSIRRSNFFVDYASVLDFAHDEEKRLFFSLLSPEYLTTLKPEYPE